MSDNTTAWLEWAKRLAAIAQNGLTFARDPFDIERYQEVRRIAAEMIAVGSDATIEQVLALLDGEHGYATPKVDVRGVVFRDDAILLVKERSDGLWTLPGGWADVSESAAENVVREVREESGYSTRARKLLALYDRNKHPHVPIYLHHVYKLFILCEITGGEAASSIETDEVGFFTEGSIPPLSIGRVTPDQIARMFEHHRNPDWPTELE